MTDKTGFTTLLSSDALDNALQSRLLVQDDNWVLCVLKITMETSNIMTNLNQHNKYHDFGSIINQFCHRQPFKFKGYLLSKFGFGNSMTNLFGIFRAASRVLVKISGSL